MTEQEWLETNDPAAILKDLASKDIYTSRKRRLLGCAFCRLVWDAIQREIGKTTVEIAESFADGLVPQKEIMGTEIAIWDTYRALVAGTEGNVIGELRAAGRTAAVFVDVEGVAQDIVSGSKTPEIAYARKKTQADAVRDLFGNPYGKRVSASFSANCDHLFPKNVFSANCSVCWPIQELAKQTYDSQDWAQLPILADMLEEFTNADVRIPEHLHNGKPHFKGCWALDILLGFK